MGCAPDQSSRIRPPRHLRFEIGRRGWVGGVVLVTFGSSVHNAKIMLGMLVKVLRGDSIATRRRFAREGNVTFEDLMRLPGILTFGPLLSRV